MRRRLDRLRVLGVVLSKRCILIGRVLGNMVVKTFLDQCCCIHSGAWQRKGKKARVGRDGLFEEHS